MTKNELRRLQRIADAHYLAEQAKLSGLVKTEVEIREKLAGLSNSRKQTYSPDEATLMTGADLRWYQWVDTRRSALNQELARTLAQREQQVSVLRKVFGRKQAIDSLAESARMTENLLTKRRDI